MAITKIVRASEIPYAQIPNDLIRDPNLSSNSVRLWAYLASHNDGYNLTYEQIERQTGLKQFAIVESTKKLIAAGWLDTERKKDSKTGRWLPMTWIILLKSTTGHSTTGDSTMEQPVHKNTNLISNDIKKTTIENFGDFESFWATYPNKSGKLAARKAYEKALTLVSAETLLAGAQRYATDPNLPEPKYVKHASTWLNAGCWDDPPLPADPRILKLREQERKQAELNAYLESEE